MIINASPEIVFKAVTDPDELTNWFPDQAILEPRVGGKMKFSFFKDPNNAHKNMDFFSRRSYYRIYTKQEDLIYMGTFDHTRLSKNSCYVGAKRSMTTRLS